jgi:CPA2 family monovalent cation:H+ antiporter-2
MLATIVACILLAFIMGSGARLLRLPALIGYIAAGMLIGPWLPGAVAERGMVSAMAEIGVALLLFSIGLHFRAKDLLAVWRVAVPGAVVQIAVALTVGAVVGHALLGLAPVAALAFGLALAISSTAVATKSLEERGKLSGAAGRIALGWLVMQDLVVVFALVLLPALAGRGGASLPLELGKAALSLAAFVLLMVLVGRRVLPWALKLVARGGSRELFTLAVVAAALGVAVLASSLFGVSFALGAFFAGVLLGESDVGHQAAAEATPLTRIFSAIFFVSVGLLLDLSQVSSHPAAALVPRFPSCWRSAAACWCCCWPSACRRGWPCWSPPACRRSASSPSADGGRDPPGPAAGDRARPGADGRIGSIIATPLLLKAAEALAPRFERRMAHRTPKRRPAAPPVPWPVLADHAIIVGAGRVGTTIIGALRRHHLPLIVVEEDRAGAERRWRKASPPSGAMPAGPRSCTPPPPSMPASWSWRSPARWRRGRCCAWRGSTTPAS